MHPGKKHETLAGFRPMFKSVMIKSPINMNHARGIAALKRKGYEVRGVHTLGFSIKIGERWRAYAWPKKGGTY